LAIDAENMPDFLVRRRERFRASQGFAGWRGPFEAWRAAGLALLRAAVGPALDGEMRTEVVAADDGPLLRRRLRVSFPTGATGEALMLAPAGPGPHPAVLLLHDHGSEFGIGKEKVLTPWDDPAAAEAALVWQARLYGGVSLGQVLVARGFVVLAADALGWGSRQGNGYEAQQALAANLMQFGLSHAGIVAAEDVQLARWLARRPEVDPTRVGVLGFSFGGFRAWQAAALCPEVAAGVASGWMARLADVMRPGSNQLRGQSAFAMLHPGVSGRLDYPDVAGLAAPKPMLFVSGRADRHFPEATAEAAFGDLRRIWQAVGAGTALETGFTDGGHVFTAAAQAQAFDFLDRSLRLAKATKCDTK
jgi:dienelactone hydrolase